MPDIRDERATTKDGIAAAILLLQGQRVILDADLAALYGVEPERLCKR